MSESFNPSQLEAMLAECLPGQSIDCVIIGLNQAGLNVLVLKWRDIETWSLPGGFIHKSESLDEAAVRILAERTGLDFPFLKQFHTFGAVDRRREMEELTKKMAPLKTASSSLVNWFRQRFTSIGYLALVDIDKCDPTPDMMSEVCIWKPLQDLPKLIFDHNLMVEKALDHIRTQANYLPIGISLLPAKFTMKEFQLLYEELLGKQLDRSNFQRKMLKLGMLIRLEKQLLGGSHKAPYLYKFDKERYQELLEKGIGFVL